MADGPEAKSGGASGKLRLRFGPTADRPGPEKDVPGASTVSDVLSGRDPWLISDRVAIRLDGPMAAAVDAKVPGRELITFPASLSLHVALLAAEAACRAWYDGYAEGKAAAQSDVESSGRAAGYDEGHQAGLAAGRAALQAEFRALLDL
ncbi:MAG: hypothetical protein JJ881_15670 [Alphaproteobacteria bacterium]|nr:hypothetical protein [Alphaproteobacteria bacterium]